MENSISYSETFSTEGGSLDGTLRTTPSTFTDPARLEQQRRKLLSLYHATTCTADDNNKCSDFSYCQAMKRVYDHVVNCRAKVSKCTVPGCNKFRSVWGHYRRCEDNACPLCSVLPTRSVQLSSPRQMQRKPRRKRGSAGRYGSRGWLPEIG